ncbi:MAG: hypothetical protein ACD_71C00045G0002 [uncultured bacterium (gcode 4)]|uniref:Uncharacterized protein n=1 Tax=uncultured bacterium (gcode 4) TaxID=1234023 RepID=K1Z662_9BACT|nr:MAG: hypothetical protein ACD_71C00045G0002 [uncultured bacterium (gcode 4)]
MQQEKIVETKKCTHCGASFEITDKDLEFYEKVSPVFDGVKYSIPTPTFCPECRQQRRLSFRNERKLYKRSCDATWKNIISVFSPDKKYPVYSSDEWWSDKWNPLDYGKDIDFSRPFFEQINKLMEEVPKIEKLIMSTQNCDYNNIIWNSKNCYMCSTTFQSEDCMYSYWCVESKNCMDDSTIFRGEWLYECLNCNNSYNLKFCENCMDCGESYFLYNCSWCKNCFLCSNLLNKQYCILNKEYTKEGYTEKINTLLNEWFNSLKHDFGKLKKETIRKYFTSKNSTDCTWDYIFDSKNCKSCYNIIDWEDIKYCYDSAVSLKDSMDMSMIWDVVELMLEAQASWYNWYKSAFVNFCWTGKNLYYCDYCMYCEDCFWCVWLRNKKYCILNKQYTREEYETLVPKIIEHMKSTWEWGEFFPSSISPFGYNETVASEYYPLGRDVALQHLYKWSDYENPRPDVSKIIPASKLPDDITKVPDDILNWAVECEVTGKPFRIIKQELEFYRKHNLPIPRRHPDQRHLDRMALRNPRKLFERKCDKCWVDMKTTYSPERPEIVYCENCYNKEIL